MTLVERLAKATGTIEEGRLTIERLPIASGRGLGVTLDQAYGSTLHLWACALVVHLWQLVCLKAQTGDVYNGEESLSSRCASYFLAAWSISTGADSPNLSQQDSLSVPSTEPAPFDLFKGAVEYWECQFYCAGGGYRLRFIKDLLKGVPEPDPSHPHQRNTVADSYIQVLNNYGLVELAGHILDKEIGREPSEGPRTRMNKLRPESFEYESIRKSVISVIVSMHPAILTALIDGQLSRKAEVGCGEVANALLVMQRQQPQPAVYYQSLCDHQGISPTARQWLSICGVMDSYINDGKASNQLAVVIDQLIAPIKNWTQAFKTRFASLHGGENLAGTRRGWVLPTSSIPSQILRV